MSNHQSFEGQGVQEYAVLKRGPEQAMQVQDAIAEEMPVALVYNGISHAVMMATPCDLDDFALGFSLTEGVVESASEIRGLDVISSEMGVEVHMEIASQAFAQLKHKRRQLSGRTGCGICGLESLQAVRPSVKPVSTIARLPDYQQVEQAINDLAQQQRLQAQCGAVHAAAFFNTDDSGITVLREDVGRHNALDKLLGALSSAKQASTLSEISTAGFIVVSSRASFEMVAKAASQSMGTLVAVSAPTTLAIELAREANMNLIGFVRPGRQLIYHQAQDR